jgi:hypothetical protein
MRRTLDGRFQLGLYAAVEGTAYRGIKAAEL